MYNIYRRMFCKFPETKIGAMFHDFLNTSQRNWCLCCAFGMSEQRHEENVGLGHIFSATQGNDQLTLERCPEQSCGWIIGLWFQTHPQVEIICEAVMKQIWPKSCKPWDSLDKIPLFYAIWKSREYYVLFWYTICPPHKHASWCTSLLAIYTIDFINSFWLWYVQNRGIR